MLRIDRWRLLEFCTKKYVLFTTYFMSSFQYGIFNVLYGLVSTLKTALHLGTVLQLGFKLQLFHSFCTVISQLDCPQIASQSCCELGFRRRVAHFRVSQQIRLIFGQELIPRGPEL